MEEEGSGRGKRSAAPAEPCYSRAAKGEAAGNQAEEELDEEMEKFYALLGNIRAMKELSRRRLRGDDTGCSNTANKRLRREEPPPPPTWKPTFQLEDFKNPSGKEEEEEEEEEGPKLRQDRESTKQQEVKEGVSLNLSLGLYIMPD